jgi:poly(3-hydroxybutyrate) depolymerase
VGRLACDHALSQRIAAFAPVSGAYYNKNITKSKDCHPETMPIPCDPGRHDIPILAFHGGADRTIRYHGDFRKGACLPDIPHWVTEWAKRDRLSTESADIAILESENGEKLSFGDGLVTLVYDGDNIPHDWPATFTNSDNGGQNFTSFNATTWILDFFNAYSLS